jgi:hypothetical protein
MYVLHRVREFIRIPPQTGKKQQDEFIKIFVARIKTGFVLVCW